jgi:hypothetical protein
VADNFEAILLGQAGIRLLVVCHTGIEERQENAEADKNAQADTPTLL